ncbi:dihydrofolate reductase [Xaviernesmea oryzae]|uniref:dihydrofolate reductase n=1 Tax=Xaviernesmea oryzae TaxID=464029 RepID=UPI0014810CE3|nr:dihydrofolate reductase [Xaviernesmea oryzae]
MAEEPKQSKIVLMSPKKERVRMPSATSIVARSHPDKIIGIENKLPWHLKTDLRHFKQRTENHAVIMGRRTLESIGRPLPNRTNIVLSRTEFESAHPLIKWAPDPETALLLADLDSIYLRKLQFFIIGGEQIYKLFERFINQVFLTEVYCGPINGDAKFETDFDDDGGHAWSEWKKGLSKSYPSTEDDEFPFSITRYERRKPVHRYKSKEEFMGRSPNFLKYLESYEEKVELDERDNLQLSFFD